jgi:MFS family permease
MLYTLYCLAGIGAALVYSGSIGSALKWFKEHRGLASGIMAAGFGGGTALFIPVISSTIRSHGYRTAFIWTGLFQGVVILLVAQFLRHPPAETRAAAATTPASTAQLGRRFLVFGQVSGALVLVYFTWGEIYSLFPATVGDYFGSRHATSNYSVLYSAKGVASIIGAGLGSMLYERSGSWSSGFYGSALMALVAAGLAFGLRASRSAQAKEVGVASPVTAR